MKYKLPEPVCAICNLSIDETGGKRIVPRKEQRKELKKSSDKQPWICQKCAGVSICKKCGSPLTWVQGRDILDDEGRALHSMIVPVSPACSNEECPDYKKITQVKPRRFSRH